MTAATTTASWNCGFEGTSTDCGVISLRKKQIKNAVCILMLSQGVPMILSGDEFGNTQFGNNNAYCQDNEISWIDWKLANANSDLLNFFSRIIAFRQAHPMLHNRVHFRNEDYLGIGYPDISLHGTKAWHPDWSSDSRSLAFLLCGNYAKEGSVRDDFIYAALNMHWETHAFESPELPDGMSWRIVANTDMQPPEDIWGPGNDKLLGNQKEFLVGPRSVIIAIGK